MYYIISVIVIVLSMLAGLLLYRVFPERYEQLREKVEYYQKPLLITFAMMAICYILDILTAK